jgi:hypothetical protein
VKKPAAVAAGSLARVRGIGQRESHAAHRGIRDRHDHGARCALQRAELGAHFDAQLVYSLSITPALIGSVILFACTLGLAGELLPAIRAARANIADKLHET